MSIATKFEYLGETKEQIREGLNKLGGNISKNDTFRSYADKIEEIYDSMPKVEESDVESATLDGTIKGGLTINPKGNTSQTGTPTPSTPIDVNVVSGDNEVVIKNKNLYKNPNPIPKAASGNVSTTTTEYIDSNSFKINLKKTSTDNNSMFCQIPLNVNDFKPNTTYTLSKKNTIVGTQFNGAGALRTYINGNYGTTTYSDSITFTTPSTLSSINVLFYGCHSSTEQGEATITIREIQLEESNSKTTFEPYTSQTYEVDLPVENLLSASEHLYGTSNGINTTYSDEKYNISGTASTSWAYIANNVPINLPAGTYTLSLTKTLPFRIYVTFTYDDNTTSTLAINSGSTSGSYTLTSQVVKYELSVSQMTSGTTYNETLGIQLEKGSKANSYTPYETTPIELCKIGDYQDYFTKNSDGQWCKYNAIGKYTFTGNETLSLQNNGKRVYVNCTASSIPNILHTPSVSQTYGLYSNKLEEKTAEQTWGGTQGISYDYNSGANAGNFDISINGISTLDAYKTAIVGIIIYYILETPYLSLIEDTTLISQLDNIQNAMSYQGTTNIGQVNDDLPFKLDVKAILDWRN